MIITETLQKHSFQVVESAGALQTRPTAPQASIHAELDRRERRRARTARREPCRRARGGRAATPGAHRAALGVRALHAAGRLTRLKSRPLAVADPDRPAVARPDDGHA